MKREDVIKGLKRLIRNAGCISIYDSDCKSCPYSHVNGCVDQIIKDALEMLKAQEPVEPTEPDEDNMRYCGSCGSPVSYEVLETPGIEYVKYSFCPNCGRPVKWDV